MGWRERPGDQDRFGGMKVIRGRWRGEVPGGEDLVGGVEDDVSQHVLYKKKKIHKAFFW